ncbi:MAG TPA: alpha/beta hydrolase [Patescibacteria group bacterium]|nr:alpha/beta hydrolase [Patescibacteria group bacterium]
MSETQANGISTSFQKVGSGPTLVLLHGWANTWESWLPIVPMLSDHYELIMPDLPGCGKTQTPPTGWTTKESAVWFEDFLSHAVDRTKPLLLAGHSYGGKILIYHQTHKTRFVAQKIILIDSSGIPNKLNDRQQILQLFGLLTPKFLKRTLPRVREQLYKTLGSDSDYIHATHFQASTLKLILKEDFTQDLANIQAPTLLIWGKDDPATPLWQGEAMHNLIPLNDFHVLPGRHFPHHEYSEKVAKLILEFLQQP